MMLYMNIGIGVVVFGIALWAKFHTEWSRAYQKFVGVLILVYGCYLALLTGSYTTFTIPGIGSIAVGSGVGAVTGLAAWVVLGTVGVATGGTAIAVGAIGMAAIGALFGVAGSEGWPGQNQYPLKFLPR